MTVRPVPVRIMAVVLIWLMITNALAVCRDTLERNVTQVGNHVIFLFIRGLQCRCLHPFRLSIVTLLSESVILTQEGLSFNVF